MVIIVTEYCYLAVQCIILTKIRQNVRNRVNIRFVILTVKARLQLLVLMDGKSRKEERKKCYNIT